MRLKVKPPSTPVTNEKVNQINCYIDVRIPVRQFYNLFYLILFDRSVWVAKFRIKLRKKIIFFESGNELFFVFLDCYILSCTTNKMRLILIIIITNIMQKLNTQLLYNSLIQDIYLELFIWTSWPTASKQKIAKRK